MLTDVFSLELSSLSVCVVKPEVLRISMSYHGRLHCDPSAALKTPTREPPPPGNPPTREPPHQGTPPAREPPPPGNPPAREPPRQAQSGA
ncbi:hypothetical protein CesoFtcFv8_019407 [Champsocephalus esox]|uniref:Uncharacterized protein n=1 Tax=Champsocephalus esox TaxID=159716 RepID=A0AAN8BDU4_9TELE|nr:hypothetical protein CesoFtcFv8_019407 [Champsocephalus esox]